MRGHAGVTGQVGELWTRNFLSRRIERSKRDAMGAFRLHCEELTGQTEDGAHRQQTFKGIFLPRLIEEKSFREDLYYRLNVLPIEVPPLRERRDDVPLLVHHFLDVARQERGCRLESVSEEAMRLLIAYSWPGNVRELENVIERLAILASGPELGVDDLPAVFHEQAPPASSPAPLVPSDGLDFNGTVEQFEADLLRQALEHTHWNKNRAAQLLGLNRTTLLEKIKKKGIEPNGDS